MSLGLKYKNDEKIIEERIVNGVPYLVYPMLEQTGVVKHGFTTRLGGVSKGYCATMNISTTRGDDPRDVEENKRRLAEAIGVRPEDMTFTHQTHTVNVAVVEEEDRGNGLWNRRHGDQCTGDLSGDILCGLCALVSGGSGAEGDRAFPFRLEGHSEPYGPCHA